jgi:hypothetical protein
LSALSALTALSTLRPSRTTGTAQRGTRRRAEVAHRERPVLDVLAGNRVLGDLATGDLEAATAPPAIANTSATMATMKAGVIRQRFSCITASPFVR